MALCLRKSVPFRHALVPVCAKHVVYMCAGGGGAHAHVQLVIDDLQSLLLPQHCMSPCKHAQPAHKRPLQAL